jgi:hypothetical protein
MSYEPARLTSRDKEYSVCNLSSGRRSVTACSCGAKSGPKAKKKKPKDARLRKKECRFGFGVENKVQKKTRTSGLPAHNKPRLSSSKPMTKFEPPRDHPRAVPGMRVVGRGWGSNSDTQLIVAPKQDLPAAIRIRERTDASSMDDADRLFMASLNDYCNGIDRKDNGPETAFHKMQELRKQRGYMDKQSYTDAVENYLSEYICKEETSMDDITNLFANIVKCADPGTSFRTLALQLQMKMLKRKHPIEFCCCATAGISLAGISLSARHAASWIDQQEDNTTLVTGNPRSIDVCGSAALEARPARCDSTRTETVSANSGWRFLARSILTAWRPCDFT